MIEVTIAQIRGSSELIKGYKATIKNTIEKTIPKDFSEDCSVEIWVAIFDIDSNLRIQSTMTKLLLYCTREKKGIL